jgi:hypothetical protein
MLSKRLYGAAMMAAVVIPSTLAGCSEDGSNPLCCTEFKVGATIQADIGGSAESQVAVQAVADFAGIASAALDDITAGCRAMAQDLDAPKAEQDKAEGNADKRARMDAWCKLAVSAITTVKAQAGGTLTIKFSPPVCEASISAKANCQAKCSGSASCDIKANPPTCEGGKLEVACKGSCEAKAGATLSCTGSCSAECKGSCQAQGGVQCSGKCEGTCKGAAQGGTGTGIKADGTCDGTCEGKCEVTAPGVTCTGTCDGECGGSCTGTAEASVKCDGECKADFEPLKCSGGELKGGCKAEAKCEGNCDASVKAKAECRPPALEIAFSGAANVQAAGKLQATFEANLGVILAFKARLEGMGKIAGSFSGNISAVTDIKAACIPPLVAAVGNALKDVEASASATVAIGGQVGTGG